MAMLVAPARRILWSGGHCASRLRRRVRRLERVARASHCGRSRFGHSPVLCALRQRRRQLRPEHAFAYVLRHPCHGHSEGEPGLAPTIVLARGMPLGVRLGEARQGPAGDATGRVQVGFQVGRRRLGLVEHRRGQHQVRQLLASRRGLPRCHRFDLRHGQGQRLAAALAKHDLRHHDEYRGPRLPPGRCCANIPLPVGLQP